MTVARRPEDFTGGDAAADGSGWEIGGVYFKRNPKRLVGREEADMVRIWMATRPGEMGGPHAFPDRGGYHDQAAVMMDGFAIMEHQLALITPKRGGHA